ncbi:hypothetical protein [Winogradskyella marincola]|uniref:Lipoprotein n=1 Tax=Winogradskyella marincola TaxID=3037795 RepID=A0ABT6G3H0_9FLAO|nr:hypothetical protein [Winogradskyella sp. YYF002]MDG4716447.1 hypothetical protein [Winogradskyella sp. YYF002]
MKKLLYLLLVTAFLNCNNERVLELPKIESAEITEVLDVSHAYIFYDETQPDSTLFNRKNLIGTTNWLVNVDKRLTLKQAIPHIQYLQDKRKKASMHKNEAAKNYFTCNDKSIKNLGFVEFSDVNYSNSSEISQDYKTCIMTVNSLKEITFSSSANLNISFSKENFSSVLPILKSEFGESIKLIMSFNESLSFQDYITIKNNLATFQNSISNNEFIY